MSALHTTGPWVYKPTSGRDYGSTIYWVPDVCHCIGSEANARLISAAPDLLEALKDVLQEMEPNHDMRWAGPRAEVCDKARFAIAKATGETA